LRGRQNVLDHEQGDLEERRARIENIWLQRPVWVVGVIVTLCVLSGTQISKVYFDYNLLNMQSAGLPAVEFEQKLINSTPKSVLFGAVVATNLEEAVRLEQQITNLPAVASIDSITKFLSEDQTGKLPIVGEIKRDLASVHFAEPDRRPVNIPELSSTLYSTYGYLGAANDEIKNEEPDLAKQLISLRRATCRRSAAKISLSHCKTCCRMPRTPSKSASLW